MGLLSLLAPKQSISEVEYAALPLAHPDDGEKPKGLSGGGAMTRARGLQWMLCGLLMLSLAAIFVTLSRLPGPRSDLTVHTDTTDVISPVHQQVDAHHEASFSKPLSTSTSTSRFKDKLQMSAISDPILGPAKDPILLYFPGNIAYARFQPVAQNTPPENRPRTPLFIGFTRNNEMLLQTVLSYVAAGWPCQDIVVVDNSGTMDANPEGVLDKDNPFFLDYATLINQYGVSILQTPTLLSFAQLMNFYLRISMAKKWDVFFWSHMDVVVLSDEAVTPYKSFYGNVLDILQETVSGTTVVATGSVANNETIVQPWAVKFFNSDYLTLVNVEAWRKIGQWDTFIPYYATDCDAYGRMYMSGFDSRDRTKVSAGRIYDLADVVVDLEGKLMGRHKKSPEDSQSEYQLNSPDYTNLRWELEKLERFKNSDQSVHRNAWQGRKKGGRNDPWTYDLEAFERAWWDTAVNGQNLFTKKWGTRECNLDQTGMTLNRMWKAKEPEK